MSSYGYGFCPQSPSFTAMKYLRTYIPHRAMLPGERYRLHLDMEAKVRVNNVQRDKNHNQNELYIYSRIQYVKDVKF